MNNSISVTIDNKEITFSEKDITDMFHYMYYNSRVWENTFWFGHQILKCPLDMWIYQEMIHEIKPDLIIETGTFRGGSALYMAQMMDIVGNGEIVTIDIMERDGRPQHPRITYLTGSSVSVEIDEILSKKAEGKKNVIVILDSDHSKDHVIKEMEMLNKYVTKNSYMIVEDSDVNGFPVRPDFGPGPMEAIQEYLSKYNDFIIIKAREKFFMTQNPCGFLKKIK